MKYTAKQIENAKVNYNSFLQYITAEQESCYSLNPHEAERRAGEHNHITYSNIPDYVKDEKTVRQFLNK